MAAPKFEKVKQFRQYFLIIIVGLLLVFLGKIGILNPILNVFQIVTVPLQISFEKTTSGVGDLLGTVTSIGQLRNDNSSLKLENALLKAENTSLKSLEEENKSLKNQLGTKDIDLKIISSARPVGNSAIGTKNVLLIDKGSSSGIATNDFVVVGKIFIGKVIEVSPRMSSVQLLSDPDTKIPAITEAGAEGIIQGEFGSGVRLTDVVQEEVLKDGELVLTSGRDGLPKGLVLGQIEKINKVEKEFFQRATIKSTINIDELKLVYIVSP